MDPFHIALFEKHRELNTLYPDGFCIIQSVDNPQKNSKGGLIFEVTNHIAARALMEGTHKLLTAEELAEFQRAQAVARSQATPVNTLQDARERFAAITGKGDKHE